DRHVPQRVPAGHLGGDRRLGHRKVIQAELLENGLLEFVGNHRALPEMAVPSSASRSLFALRLGLPAELLISHRGGTRKTRAIVTSIRIPASMMLSRSALCSLSPTLVSAITATCSVPSAGSSSPTATTRPAITLGTLPTSSSTSSGAMFCPA